MPDAPAASDHRRTLAVILVAGLCCLTAMTALAVTQPPLGTPLFFVLAAVGVVAYGAVMARVWNAPPPPRLIFLAALALAALFRVPVALAP
ncbi:MAG: hypothetical protein ABIP65_09155, partial [Vicinamibacterales bacterium]